jgi:hypothetical protein
MSVDYQRRWSVRVSVAGFGQDICEAWASEYSAGAELDPEDRLRQERCSSSGRSTRTAPTGRAGFETGVQDGENLLVDVFPNAAGQAIPMRRAVLRQSSAFRLDATVVEECLDLASANDRLFAKGWD